MTGNAGKDSQYTSSNCTDVLEKYTHSDGSCFDYWIEILQLQNTDS